MRALISGGVEPHVRVLEQQLRELRGDLEGMEIRLRDQLNDLAAAVERSRQTQEWTLERIARLAADQRDDIPTRRHRLALLRETPEYERLWTEREPLITVRIATLNAADRLIARPVASVLRQTYEHFEIVVVGDACTDDTAERLARLNDPRIRFFNLESRPPYPDRAWWRWMVAGSPGMNLGAEVARGSWIAPLDDDDEFSDDHLEVLLKDALENRRELVYGLAEREWIDTGERDIVGEYPPTLGAITMQAALYLQSLSTIFPYDTKSWLSEEPGDWNLVRRMMEAEVRIGFVDHVVSRLWSTHRTPG